MLFYMGSGAALAAYRREKRVQVLTECAGACSEASRQDLEGLRAGGEDRARHAAALAALEACRELCSLTADLMARESTLARYAYAPCAEACRRCAEACDALSPDDRAAACAHLCRQSEEVCRRCADSIGAAGRAPAVPTP